MKTHWTLGFAGLLLLVGGGGWYFHHADKPRRDAIQTLSVLSESLKAGDSTRLLQTVAMPATLRDRTPGEQFEFMAKALREEITPDGLALLQREGQFGTLTNLFPGEGILWAEQADVCPEDCVAFKFERNGLRTEVVLAKPSSLNSQPPTPFQIVRCNNVTASAPVQVSTVEKP